MKISQWKSLTGESRTDSTSCEFSSPRRPTWTEFPSPSSRGRQHTVSAAGEAHSSLSGQGAYWDLIRSAWPTTCVPGLSLSPPGVKAPTINILLAETLWCDPRPPSKQDPVTWQEIPSLRVTSQLPGQSRAFLWARSTLYWKFLFLSRSLSVWEQKYNKLPHITLFGHMPCHWGPCPRHLLGEDRVRVQWN